MPIFFSSMNVPHLSNAHITHNICFFSYHCNNLCCFFSNFLVLSSFCCTNAMSTCRRSANRRLSPWPRWKRGQLWQSPCSKLLCNISLGKPKRCLPLGNENFLATYLIIFFLPISLYSLVFFVFLMSNTFARPPFRGALPLITSLSCICL